MLRFLILSLCLLVPMQALAAGSQPKSDEIQRVHDYFYGPDATRPLLVESKLCSQIVEEGEKKNECSSELMTNSVTPGSDAYLWMNFMVPKAAPDQTVLIQFNHDGITRLTREITVRSALRYRSWKKFKLDKPGSWTIKILLDGPKGVTELDHVKLSVADAPMASAE